MFYLAFFFFRDRTRYVVMAIRCHILWQSKLQSETALSTMEAEIVALANSCVELFPIMVGVSMMCNAIGPPFGNIIIHVSIHEDNAEALIQTKSPPSKFTSCSKNHHTKTIWFKLLSWQWPGLTFWKYEDTFEDIGHDQDMSSQCPRTFSSKRPWPQSHWRTYVLCPKSYRT